MNRTVLIGLGVLGAVGALGLVAASSIKTPAMPTMPAPEPDKPSGLFDGAMPLLGTGGLPKPSEVIGKTHQQALSALSSAMPSWAQPYTVPKRLP